MEFVEKKYSVPKEADEVVVAIVKMVKLAKEAGKDGFQPITDIPAVVMGVFADLQKALDGASALPAEMKAKPLAVAADLCVELDGIL